jgi:hypothetical protein
MRSHRSSVPKRFRFQPGRAKDRAIIQLSDVVDFGS